MSGSQTRIELFIDIFELTGQKARALVDLKPSQLIKAILQEFRTLEHLGDSVDGYVLVRNESGAELTDEGSLEDHKLKKGERLTLVERALPLPEETQRPSAPIYLRDVRAGKTYPLQWLPAIIGRRSEHQPKDALVAVDLRADPSGPRVSRRHVMVTEEDGHFFIENLSSNPVSLISAQSPGPLVVTAQRQPLAHGDVIKLDRSEIELKFIVRPPAPAAQASSDGPSPS